MNNIYFSTSAIQNQHSLGKYIPGQKILGITGRSAVQITIFQNWYILKRLGHQNSLWDRRICENTGRSSAQLIFEDEW